MARAAIPKPPQQIIHAPSAPEVVQAAQIGLNVLRIAKTATWAEVSAAPPAQIRALVTLDAEQQHLLTKHSRILPHLRVQPLVTVYACGTCERYGLATSATVGTRCPFTMRCDGAIYKATKVNYRQPKPKKPKGE